MPSLICLKCGKRLKTDAQPGQRTKCVDCGAANEVPYPQPEILPDATPAKPVRPVAAWRADRDDRDDGVFRRSPQPAGGVPLWGWLLMGGGVAAGLLVTVVALAMAGLRKPEREMFTDIGKPLPAANSVEPVEPKRKSSSEVIDANFEEMKRDFYDNRVALVEKLSGRRIRITAYVTAVRDDGADLHGPGTARIGLPRADVLKLKTDEQRTFEGTFAGYNPEDIYTSLRLTGGVLVR